MLRDEKKLEKDEVKEAKELLKDVTRMTDQFKIELIKNENAEVHNKKLLIQAVAYHKEVQKMLGTEGSVRAKPNKAAGAK